VLDRPDQHHAPLAQSGEQPPCKRQAAGSIPCTEHHFSRLAHSQSSVLKTEGRIEVTKRAPLRESNRQRHVVQIDGGAFESRSEHQSRV
jgi:hypothetical protein